MFTTILVPTDGSPLSDKAVNVALEFAKGAGAKIVGISVAESYPISPLSETPYTSDAEHFDIKMRELAQKHVQKIADAAKEMDVPCETIVTQANSPYQEIINAAKSFHCDAIFMASHGRKGLSKLFVGSETQKVLAHSDLPIMIIR
ncbi:MAG TPA: universal stress protein [Burkholderiaceae bacterium]|nr:universal stress protein [Burkholderiaceae bacterium]